MAYTSNSIVVSTLGDVIAALKGRDELAHWRRKILCSAVRTLSRCAGVPPETIGCDLATVRGLVESLSPARHGLSPGYWANVRCNVFAALRLCGIKVLSGRCKTAATREWAFLVEALNKYQRAGLLPFVRWCLEQNIQPFDVDQEIFESYAEVLQNYSSRFNRRKKHLLVGRVWNQCGEEVAGWPPFRVRITYRHDRYCISRDQLPTSFHADLEDMLQHAQRIDLASEVPRRPIGRITARNHRNLLYRLASACVRQGVDPNELCDLKSLLQPDMVRKGLAYMIDRRPGQPTEGFHSPGLYKVAELTHAVARDWACLPPDQLRRLKTIRNNLRVRQQGMTEKNCRTLRFFKDERLLARLLALPERVSRSLPRKAKLTRRQALMLQLALVVELLTVAPIRCKNLVEIRLDKHLISTGEQTHLVFAESETKSSTLIEFALPPSTVCLLDDYLRRARPVLAEAANPYLFPGRCGSHKQAAHMSAQLADFVRKKIGVRVTAHQFRHLAGFHFLKVNPGCYEVVRLLLGHKSILTTMRFYAGMEVDAAIELYDGHIAQRRAEICGASSQARRPRTHQYA